MIEEYKIQLLNELCLIHNDYPILGFPIQQTWTALYFMNKILHDNPDIKRVVELGTYSGGLAIFFGHVMKARGGEVLTVDINMPSNPHSVLSISDIQNMFEILNIDFHQLNCFEYSTIELIKDFIKDERAIIFNDGGTKKDALPIYTNILKPNDIIWTHDWLMEVFIEDLKEDMLSTVECFKHLEFSLLNSRILSFIKCSNKDTSRIEKNRRIIHG